MLIKTIKIVRSILSKEYVRADLHFTLSAANPLAPLSERLDWLDDLLEWIRLPVAPRAKGEEKSLEAARVRFLLQFLERNPDLHRKVTQTLQSILFESDFADFFSEAGIQIHYGFAREFIDRLSSALLPEYRDTHSFRQTFSRIIRHREDLEWLSSVDTATIRQLAQLFACDEKRQAELSERFTESLKAAITILTARMTALSLEPDLKARLPNRNPVTSPFFEIQSSVAQLRSTQLLPQTFTEIDDQVARCRTEVLSVYPVLESSGVSVDLVYKLDTIKILLSRIGRLNDVLRQIDLHRLSPEAVIGILLTISAQDLEKTQLLPFLGANVNLIARKLVERTSETGEHYIARTAKEKRSLFWSAAGGGVVTVFTTVFKSAIGRLNAPLFIEGFLTGFNYAASFVVIHLYHFTLATKTPAMTASTLASRLGQLNSTEDEKAFAKEVRDLVRSAGISVLGNLGLVIPGCFLFDLAFFGLTGRHVFAASYGLDQVYKHNPIFSLTIIYAMVTGFILWFSSIIGPWIENWFVYRRYFELFEESNRMRRLLGKGLQHRLTGAARRNLAGLCTNIALGFMLGFSGTIGTFFGLPLQVRHVTLAAGTLTFSLCAMDNLSDNGWLVFGAVISVLVIGIFNFAVSFSLSLFVAARARDVQIRKLFQIMGRKDSSAPASS